MGAAHVDRVVGEENSQNQHVRACPVTPLALR